MRMGYWVMRHRSTQVQGYWGDRLINRTRFEDWFRSGMGDRGVGYGSWSGFEYGNRSCGDERCTGGAVEWC
jgi:hypothetical protein